MIVIPPLKLTPTNTTSTVPEPSTGETVWNAATNYTVGQKAIRVETHRVYECRVAGVSATTPENDPTKWLDIAPTNKWAMFDNMRSQQTTNLDSMTITITPGERVTALALLGLEAQKVTVTMTVGSTIVYGPVVRGMSGRITTTWSQYFFGNFDYIPSLLLQDLPPVNGAVITILIENTTGQNVACSEVVVGNKIFLGHAQYNAESDSLNFSKIERNDFGESLLLARRTVPKVNVDLMSDKALVPQIRKARIDLNAVPALWSAMDDKYDDPFFEAVFIYGIYKQFTINLSGPSYATVTLELEEL